MGRYPFLSFMLFMALVWMQFYAAVRERFNGLSEYKARAAHLQKKVRRAELARALEQEHFLEFRQYVATLMPDVLKEKGLGEEGYPYRNLASIVIHKENEMIRGAIAKTLFEAGKSSFNKGEYAKAAKAFRQIIDRFSFSPHVVESYFLLAETHFKENELEECTRVIRQMIELFPQHELTGIAMVSLGRIYQINNRIEEAVDIYKTVLRSYPQRDVAAQAQSMLRGLDL
ncbi:MAG: tol-pal system YbgF family protein [Bdellovibrionales bacterium]